MSEQTILLFCAFGVPIVLIAVGAAAVGFILRRVRPDLYMTDEEKEQAKQRAWEQAALGGDNAGTNNNKDDNKEQI